jgi:hypothetical protein
MKICGGVIFFRVVDDLSDNNKNTSGRQGWDEVSRAIKILPESMIFAM